MKALLTRLERWLTAITFAEANEHETARQILALPSIPVQNGDHKAVAGRPVIHRVGV